MSGGAVNPSMAVSTHSRAEAAALWSLINSNPLLGFNTQPREGGCALLTLIRVDVDKRFNTQPREGGCSLPKKARKISVLNTAFR